MNRVFAKDKELILNDGSTAIIVDETGTGLDRGRIIGKAFSLCLNITAIDASSGNETYNIFLEDSDDNITFAEVDGGRFAQMSSSASTALVGIYSLVVNSDKRYVRYNCDVGGTTPSITTEIFLALA